MVEKDRDRKSERNFNLKKGSTHSFDLEKKPTRKFDLSKEDPEDTIFDASVADGGNNEESRKKSFVWLYVMIALVIIGVIIAFCLKGCNGNGTGGTNDSNSTDPVEQAEDTVKQDNAADNTAALNQETKAENNTNSENQSIVSDNGNANTVAKGETAANNDVTNNTAGATESNKAANAASTQTATPTVTANTGTNIDADAQNVIIGKYGNGRERIKKLKADGKDAAAVQRRVNEMKRQGAF